MEHPVVFGLIPSDAFLEGFRISKSAQVQSFVRDRPERFGRKVVSSPFRKGLDDENQFSKGNTSVLQDVWLHIRRRPSQALVAMVNLTSVAFPLVVVLLASVFLREITLSDQVLDHDR